MGTYISSFLENTEGEKKKEKGFERLKDTISVSLRMAKFVWSVDRFLFSVAFITVTIPAVIPFINIYIYKLIIDFVVNSLRTETVSYQFLYFLIFLRLFTYFVQEVSFRAQELAERLLWLKVPIELNQQVLGKMSSLDMQYFEDPQFKDLMEKVKDSYTYRPQNLITNMLFCFQSLIQVVIALVAIASLNFFLIFIVGIVAITEFILQTRQSEFAWAVWGWNSPLRKRFWYVAELLQSAYYIKEVKIFKLAKRFLSEVKDINQKFYHDNKKIAKNSFYLNFGFNFVSTLIFVAVEVFVILQALARRATVGDIGFYTGVVSNFQNGLGGFFMNLNRLFESSLYVKSIFELLDTKTFVKISNNPKKVDLKTPPKIEFRNVTFSYPGRKEKVLENFSLTINPFEKIALVGENGAGKTTIIKLLARFYDVVEGEILINRINIKDLGLNEWYENLGVLFQDFNRYEDLAKENIHFGRVNESEYFEKIKSAAKSSGASEFLEKFEKRYEQMLGTTFEGAIELSTGQWQKISLSRAFFRNAKTLVLDEPTASLDAKAEAEIFERVERLSKDSSVIIISHRFSTVRRADKIYVIEEGKIIESGTHDELMSLRGKYETLFSLQAKGYK